MISKRFRIVHHIMENNDPRPIVTHLFYGDTPEEAHRVYEAHRQSDEFLRQCDDTGLFQGRVKCYAEAYLERVPERLPTAPA